MSKGILLALLVLCGGVGVVQYVRIVDAGDTLEASARDLLANWHPRYEAAVRVSLTTRAAELGLRLVDGSVRLGRVPTARETLASRRDKAGIRNYEVSIEAAYVGELVGLAIERKMRVVRVITTDATRAPSASSLGSMPPGPLPIFVD